MQLLDLKDVRKQDYAKMDYDLYSQLSDHPVLHLRMAGLIHIARNLASARSQEHVPNQRITQQHWQMIFRTQRTAQKQRRSDQSDAESSRLSADKRLMREHTRHHSGTHATRR